MHKIQLNELKAQIAAGTISIAQAADIVNFNEDKEIITWAKLSIHPAIKAAATETEWYRYKQSRLIYSGITLILLGVITAAFIWPYLFVCCLLGVMLLFIGTN